jgi:DNA-directed RNA polymerase beta subunit
MISAHQARERLVSYKAKLQVRIRWTVSGPDGETANYEDVRDCGQLPVMVKVCLHVYSSVSFCAELPLATIVEPLQLAEHVLGSTSKTE